MAFVTLLKETQMGGTFGAVKNILTHLISSGPFISGMCTMNPRIWPNSSVCHLVIAFCWQEITWMSGMILRS